MRVEEIWRYPVKSMAGERLEQALLSTTGIEGDRVVQVRDGRGRIITARTHPSLLRHRALLGHRAGSGRPEPLVDGRPWNDPEVLAEVRQIAGPAARLVRYDGPDRFDILPLLVATDGAIAAFGKDSRRLRPNLVIGGVKGLEERAWEGKTLRIGEVLIGVQDLRGRCVMTTFDPDTLAQDTGVLKDIVKRFEGTLALNCAVLEPGTIRVGQAVELLA